MEDRIQEEYTRSSAESGGDSSAVDEFSCMERALGHRRGQIRGVGRVGPRSSLKVSVVWIEDHDFRLSPSHSCTWLMPLGIIS
ncbi:hypothetical protein L1987_16209 [Smallanthus sonchifolius]|uniref:Uncharacterized protein n=1 Tax=Smallanthus sonchifolius TaxID=185202 RepID=A0ACB9J895_9ASTR|nr:hypothetical protein L1987_16209 [Smallanthus sonchifolius]